MSEIKFAQTDGLWFNPIANQGSSILLERNNADDKAQVVLGFVQTPGARLKFEESFDKTPTIVFNPGEFTKPINLEGIVKELPNPNTIKIRINNVSEGDTYVRPFEITVKLTAKTPTRKKENPPMANPAAQTAIQSATTTTEYSELKKLITTELKKISTRLTALETGTTESAEREEVVLESLQTVDDETTQILEQMKKLMAKLTGTTTPTPTTPTTPDPSSPAGITQIVIQALQQAGIIPTTTAPKTATVIIDGKQITVPVSGTKPTCPPIVTTQVITTPVEPELQLVYKDCGSTTTPSVCGSYASPIMATLLNGFKNTVEAQPFPNTYQKAGFYRDGNRIYLFGNVTGGADQLESSNKTKTIFIIPASCAPKTQQSFTVAGRTSNGGIEAVELIIWPNTDGTATVYAQNEGIMPQTIAIVGDYLLAA